MNKTNLSITGYIEGYYGRSLDWSERLELLQVLSGYSATHYLLAPKQEVALRSEWQAPFTDRWQQQLARCSAEASGVRMVPGLSPGLYLDYDSKKDVARAGEQLAALVSLGCPEVGLLLDDIEFQLPSASRFKSLAEAHAHLIAEALNRLQAESGFERLWICPTVYADALVKRGEQGYLQDLLAAVPDSVVVLWCGEQIVPGDLSRLGAIQGCAQTLCLWDNYYANDYCPWRLFLGPPEGRNTLPQEAAGLMFNATGLPQTDAFLLSAFAADTTAARESMLRSAQVPEALFAKVLPYLYGPFMHPKIPDDWRDCCAAARTLAFEPNSALQREWYPWLLMLDRDLSLHGEGKSRDWIDKYYPASLASRLYAGGD